MSLVFKEMSLIFREMPFAFKDISLVFWEMSFAFGDSSDFLQGNAAFAERMPHVLKLASHEQFVFLAERRGA